MKIFVFMSLMFLTGCSSYENSKIDLERANENNPLIVPPCLKEADSDQ